MVNDKKEILCQKRSLLKDSFPGKWDPFFGGHMASGVGYLGGAKVEIKEELEIDLDESKLKLWKIFKNVDRKEFEAIFIYKWNGQANKVIFEKEEIDQIKWVDREEISKLVLTSEDNNWNKIGYEKELLEFIKGL